MSWGRGVLVIQSRTAQVFAVSVMLEDRTMSVSTTQRRCPCGNLCDSKGRDSKGRQKFGTRCNACRKLRYGLIKASICGTCGFVAKHPCQLDIDHIDGNHSNNDPGNLQVMCANCHRLKTVIARDHVSVVVNKESRRSLFD